MSVSESEESLKRLIFKGLSSVLSDNIKIDPNTVFPNCEFILTSRFQSIITYLDSIKINPKLISLTHNNLFIRNNKGILKLLSILITEENVKDYEMNTFLESLRIKENSFYYQELYSYTMDHLDSYHNCKLNHFLSSRYLYDLDVNGFILLFFLYNSLKGMIYDDTDKEFNSIIDKSEFTIKRGKNYSFYLGWYGSPYNINIDDWNLYHIFHIDQCISEMSNFQSHFKMAVYNLIIFMYRTDSTSPNSEEILNKLLKFIGEHENHSLYESVVKNLSYAG